MSLGSNFSFKYTAGMSCKFDFFFCSFQLIFCWEFNLIYHCSIFFNFVWTSHWWATGYWSVLRSDIFSHVYQVVAKKKLVDERNDIGHEDFVSEVSTFFCDMIMFASKWFIHVLCFVWLANPTSTSDHLFWHFLIPFSTVFWKDFQMERAA